jgi:hypothetical protein
MDEYADIYYVDSPRNADHRTPAPGGIFGNVGNSFRPVVPPPQGSMPVPSRTVYVQPSQSQPVQYVQPYPTAYPYPPGYPQATAQSPLSSLFGNLHAGQVIAMVAEALAAFRALPAAPVATRDVPTDVANQITYDTALAQHAKTDEQIRTIGHLVGRLVR